MKKRAIVSAAACLIALILVGASASAQVVQRVIDGDTVVIAGIGTVRLIGIDTPETVDTRSVVEQFGKEASAFLRQMVQGKAVRLDYDAKRLDRYRRTLAYVYLPDGTFVNAEMVRQGYAHAYTEFPFKYVQQFLAFEREARETGRGLWGNGFPVGRAALPTLLPGERSVPVYVTRNGNKYHRDGCTYLARGKIAISLNETVGHYTACKVCKPPTLAR